MNIYVGNLAYAITEDELRENFQEYGEVNSVNIIKDRDTGNSKGFGFVEMEVQAEAEKAIKELNGLSIKGREIKVNETRPKNDRFKGNNRRNW